MTTTNPVPTTVTETIVNASALNIKDLAKYQQGELIQVVLKNALQGSYNLQVPISEIYIPTTEELNALKMTPFSDSILIQKGGVKFNATEQQPTASLPETTSDVFTELCDNETTRTKLVQSKKQSKGSIKGMRNIITQLLKHPAHTGDLFDLFREITLVDSEIKETKPKAKNKKKIVNTLKVKVQRANNDRLKKELKESEQAEKLNRGATSKTITSRPYIEQNTITPNIPQEHVQEGDLGKRLAELILPTNTEVREMRPVALPSLRERLAQSKEELNTGKATVPEIKEEDLIKGIDTTNQTQLTSLPETTLKQVTIDADPHWRLYHNQPSCAICRKAVINEQEYAHVGGEGVYAHIDCCQQVIEEHDEAIVMSPKEEWIHLVAETLYLNWEHRVVNTRELQSLVLSEINAKIQNTFKDLDVQILGGTSGTNGSFEVHYLIQGKEDSLVMTLTKKQPDQFTVKLMSTKTPPRSANGVRHVLKSSESYYNIISTYKNTGYGFIEDVYLFSYRLFHDTQGVKQNTTPTQLFGFIESIGDALLVHKIK